MFHLSSSVQEQDEGSLVDTELPSERSGKRREGRHPEARRVGREERRARGRRRMEGRGIPPFPLFVDFFPVEQDPDHVDGARRERRRCGFESVPRLAARGTPGGIDEDQADRFGGRGKARLLLPAFGEENRLLRGKGDGAYGNALRSAPCEKGQGRCEGESVRRTPPSPARVPVSGHIKYFSGSAGRCCSWG
jgi:hypothetical protein